MRGYVSYAEKRNLRIEGGGAAAVNRLSAIRVPQLLLQSKRYFNTGSTRLDACAPLR
jgi:hypothetical protein